MIPRRSRLSRVCRPPNGEAAPAFCASAILKESDIESSDISFVIIPEQRIIDGYPALNPSGGLELIRSLVPKPRGHSRATRFSWKLNGLEPAARYPHDRICDCDIVFRRT